MDHRSAVFAELNYRLVRDSLFPEQREPFEDPHRFKFLDCPRRAGKSVTWVAWCFADWPKHPRALYGYAAKTQKTAKLIIWRMVEYFCELYKVEAKLNRHTLEVTFPNNAMLFLSGIDQENWGDRFRGPGFRSIGLDEVAFYGRINTKNLSEELRPSLIDYLGQLWMMTTPGRRKRGFVYDLHTGAAPGWKRYSWLPDKNPYVAAQWKQDHDEIHAANPNADDNPTHAREYHGHWVEDASNLTYSMARLVPNYEPTSSDHYLCGVDVGYDGSSMAFCVACYSDDHPRHVVLEAYKRDGMLIPDVARELKRIVSKYPGVLIYGDPEARHFLQELRARFKVPVQPAVKTGKLDRINLYNSDVACGRVEFVEGDTYDLQEEHGTLTRSQRKDGSWGETEHQQRDVSDAQLYTYAKSYAWRYEKQEAGPAPGSKEAEAAAVEKLWDKEERSALEAQKRARRGRHRRLAIV